MKINKKRFLKRFLYGLVWCAILFWAAYIVWQPGLTVRDGRDNHNRNALWIGHGWLGGDSWFAENPSKNPHDFRDPAKIRQLAALCAQNGITDIYPHLCPADAQGRLASWDDAQIERLLDNAPNLRVMPWIGGRLDGTVKLDSKPWRASFTASLAKLLRAHPRLAGVHLNFEPLKSEDAAMLTLLDEVRAALPVGKLLSISCYPPPEGAYPLRLNWSDSYFQQVAGRCDQVALMAYDTSSPNIKLFEWLVARWTQRCLELCAGNKRGTQVLIGVPTYDDNTNAQGITYHRDDVENVETSLRGVHRALNHWKTPPSNFQGVAIYSEWTTNPSEWQRYRREWQ